MVSGNDLWVKDSSRPDAALSRMFRRAFAVTVNGQQLGIHDLKPGMTIQRTTITTTSPS